MIITLKRHTFKGGMTSLPRGSSDAALTPYHVERSKLFVMDRIGASVGRP